MTRAAIKNAEERLRQALLEGNVSGLDALLHDALLHVGSDGVVLRKADVLAAEGQLTRYEPSALRVELLGPDVGIVVVRVDLAGMAQGRGFAGSYRFSRTWIREHDSWRVAAAHASAIVEASEPGEVV